MDVGERRALVVGDPVGEDTHWEGGGAQIHRTRALEYCGMWVSTGIEE